MLHLVLTLSPLYCLLCVPLSLSFPLSGSLYETIETTCFHMPIPQVFAVCIECVHEQRGFPVGISERRRGRTSGREDDVGDDYALPCTSLVDSKRYLAHTLASVGLCHCFIDRFFFGHASRHASLPPAGHVGEQGGIPLACTYMGTDSRMVHVQDVACTRESKIEL